MPNLILDNWTILLFLIIFTIWFWWLIKSPTGKLSAIISTSLTVMVIAVALLNMFSNIVNQDGKEFAVYLGPENRLVVQKEPGTHFGVYQSYYFNKQIYSSLCRPVRNPFGEVVTRGADCVIYTILPEKMEGLFVNGALFAKFKMANDHGEANTETLYKHYRAMIHEKVIQNYPDFIKVTKGN